MYDWIFWMYDTNDNNNNHVICLDCSDSDVTGTNYLHCNDFNGCQQLQCGDNNYQLKEIMNNNGFTYKQCALHGMSFFSF